MKHNKSKAVLLAAIIMCLSAMLTGCWNYREIEQLAIIAGVAIDKNEEGQIKLTLEVVNISTDGQTAFEPVYVEISGESFFDASRRGITLQGKRLYWSHAKVVIVSEEIAREDIIKYLDFLFRDAEAREDIWLLISQEKTAAEIIKAKGQAKPIISFEIDDTMRSQRSVSRFPFIELYEFFDRYFYKNVDNVLPLVRLNQQENEVTAQVEGSAIIKGNKMIGFLDEEHTKRMLWLRDEVKGGLVVINSVEGTEDDVTLEIYKSKTKLTPQVEEDQLKMKVEIELDASIGEILGHGDYINGEGKKRFVEFAQKYIKKQIEETYITARDQYESDIFGFGRRFEMKLPQVWNQIKDEWEQWYAELELDVTVKLKIRGSATTRTPLRPGE